MVSKITEIQTNDGEITIGELIRFLLSTPEFQTKKMTDVLLSLTEHTHDINDLDNATDLVRQPELRAALGEFDEAVVEALNSLEGRLDIPFLQAQIKALQGKPDFDPSKIEKRLKALESQKPEHKTTVIQNFDKSRIDKIEKKQSEVVGLLGKIIDDSSLKVEDLRKEIAAEIAKKIQKEDKHVNIIGGVGGVNKLKLLFDVNVDGVTDGQVLAWDATAEKWVASSSGGGGSGTVTSVAATVPTGLTVSGSPITTSGTLAIGLDTGYVIPTQATLDGKLDANTPITGATKTKVTYDANGLITAGADATTADIAASTDKNYVTDAQLTVIGNTSGTNTGDQSLFSTIAVSGQSNVVADSTSDTLTLVAGSGVTITTDAATDSITIAASGGGAPTGAEYVVLSTNGSLTHERVLTAGTGISITDGGAGSTVTVASTITQYTDEMAQDAVGGILVDSSEIDFTYNDATPSITASIVAGSIDETKLDTSVNASLDLADSALQASAIGVSVQAHSAVLDATTASFTTADETKLDGIEAGADVTDTANVTAAGALMDSEVTNLAAVKAFNPTDYATAAQGALADSAVQPADLATVATTGAYSDLSGTPTIPSAIFSTISVSGQSDVVADSATDTLTLVAGSGVTITTNATTDAITIAASGSAPAWGDITGTLSAQTDLQSALDAKTNASVVPSTAPSAGQILVGNAGGTAYAPATVSGSGATISLASTGVVTISGIANASLTNSSITIAGTSTALGGSITQDTITGLGTTGLVKRTGANTLAIATAGTDYQGADATLTALAAYNTNGLITQTAADTFTGRTLTGGGGISVTNGDGVSGNPTLGVAAKQSIWIPSAAMYPSNTNGCAALAQTSMGAAMPDIKTLDFDTATQEYCEFSIAFPKGWDEGTITMQYFWSHPSTTTNFGVAWGLQGRAFSDADALATAWVAGTVVTDTGGTTNTQYVTAESGTLTIDGSPAAGDICYFRIYRNVNNASDNLAVDARLHGIKIFYNINTLDDT